jgi:hypothetical protein
MRCRPAATRREWKRAVFLRKAELGSMVLFFLIKEDSIHSFKYITSR